MRGIGGNVLQDSARGDIALLHAASGCGQPQTAITREPQLIDLAARCRVLRIIGAPLTTRTGKPSRAAQRQQVLAVLDQVGLRAQDADKYPHEFSGGQRQRIAIARALITRPKLIVADEPVSALDVSVQAQVLNLMQDLQRELGLSYLFISHDLAVVQHVCDQVIVLYQGEVVERGTPQKLFSEPEHPYTQALVKAAPRAL